VEDYWFVLIMIMHTNFTNGWMSGAYRLSPSAGLLKNKPIGLL
jgi:hypothetical protein